MKKILLMFFLYLFANLSWAQSSDYYYFADSAIGIFADIRDADLTQSESEKEDGLKWTLRNSVHKKHVYSDVMFRLKQFEKSSHERIRQAATLLSGGVLMLQVSNDHIGEFAEKILNNPKLALERGVVIRTLAELSENSKSAWEAYATGGEAITFSLIDMPITSKELKGMSAGKLSKKVTNSFITKSQTDLLKLHLQKSFGAVLSDDSNAGFFDLPAIAWWRFLNEGWIPATN